MEFYPLLIADHPRWHTERGYSHEVRGVLVRALRSLDHSRHREQGFARTYTLIRPFLDAPMGMHQRLRLWYMAARGRAARTDDEAALYWLDETLNLDSELGDTADRAQLHVLRGGIYRRMLRFGLASYDHLCALHVLASDVTRSSYHDAAFRLQVLSQLAGFEFYLGRYWKAQQHLTEAHYLLPYVPQPSTQAAYLTWMHSLLNRWAAKAGRALQEALAAAKVFVDLGNASSAGRITFHAAECALDLAQRLDVQGSECDRLLSVAHEHLMAARRLATSDHDENGQVLTALGLARWSRIARRNEARRETLESLLAHARGLDDEILIAQSYTLLGDELAFHEEREQANTCYRAALDALEGTDSPAAGVWAWRSLRFPEEWLV